MSLTGKTKASTYKDLLQMNNSNSGVDTTTRNVVDGEGTVSAISLSDDSFKITPQNDDTTEVFAVFSKGMNRLLRIDSTNSLVKAGSGQNVVNTQFKEFGLHDFSPTQGYHNPMVCNNMMFSDSGEDIIADDSMFSNGADPATTLDLSANGTASSLVACTWFVQSNITIDEVRVVATCNSSQDLNFHLYSYTLDVSSAHGDLSSGALLAHINTVMSATNTTMKTDTLAIDSADVDANKVIYAFVENEGGTGDVTCQLVVKYHLR